VDGGTPIHIALKVAVRELMEGSEVKHLVVLTDGAPMYAGSNHRPIHEKNLRLFVREEVQRARRQGIHVSALLVGDRNKEGKIQFDVSKDHLQFMFGSERYWKCIDDQHLGEDLVRAVSSSFLSYLLH
jgi:Mg-chelatase subunit ChlD